MDGCPLCIFKHACFSLSPFHSLPFSPSFSKSSYSISMRTRMYSWKNKRKQTAGGRERVWEAKFLGGIRVRGYPPTELFLGVENRMHTNTHCSALPKRIFVYSIKHFPSILSNNLFRFKKMHSIGIRITCQSRDSFNYKIIKSNKCRPFSFVKNDGNFWEQRINPTFIALRMI